MESDVLCRLCTLKADNYIDVFKEEGIKLNLAYKVKHCLQIWLIPEDNLPKTICIDCCQKVDDYFAFYSICSQSQSSLLEIFGRGNKEISTEVENVEVKPSDDSGTHLIENEFIEDRNQEADCHYVVDSVLGEKSPTEVLPKSKQPVAKHVSLEESLSLPSRTLLLSDVAPTKKIRSRSFKEESMEQEDNTSIDDDSFNQKNSLDGILSLSCPKLSKLEGYIWKCTDCNDELNSLAALKSHHQDIHNQPPNYKCNECPKTYTKYRSFARHIKLHGNSKKFSCDICGKCFSQKTVLQSHSTVHSEERPFVCCHCGKAFKQFSSLYLHSKCHLPEQVKPKYPCKWCSKEFSTKHTMEIHTKIHTGERNFICDICGKRFIVRGSLDYHMLSHNDVKPHSCPVCGKGFKTARLLTKHSTLHTGVKPHQCDICGKQFREKGALKEHNRIHTGAMPYSCEFCGKLFRFKGILTVHRRLHTGERPYRCSECNREFTNWANCNKHMKRRHRGGVAMTETVLTDGQIGDVASVGTDHSPLGITTQELTPASSFVESPTPSSITTDHTIYKLPDDTEISPYRLSPYTSPIQMGTVNYYIPQIHTGVLPRAQ